MKGGSYLKGNFNMEGDSHEGDSHIKEIFKMVDNPTSVVICVHSLNQKALHINSKEVFTKCIFQFNKISNDLSTFVYQ